MRHLAVSALGHDRPGIVAAVTGTLLRHDLDVHVAVGLPSGGVRTIVS